jgi:tetratricopeptide (TPR) repeat protein
MLKNRTFQILLGIAVVLPACDGFVCSQERIKAIELANRGADEFKNNLYDSAEKDLKQAIQTDPTYEIAYYNLGKIFQKQRKWDKAIEYFEQAAQRKPDNGNYQYDLGEAYFESKKLDQAEKALQAATSADPKLFKAWWRLGMVYKILDRPKEADDALPPRHRGEPALLEVVRRARLPLPRLRLQQGSGSGVPGLRDREGRRRRVPQRLRPGAEEPQAVRAGHSEFKKAIDLDPELYDALYNAGMAYSDWFDEAHGNDQKERAREYLQKFVHHAGKSPTATTEGGERQAVRPLRSIVRP